MRDISHWSPGYVVDRLRVAAHSRQHKDEPWLTAEAVHLLDRLLRATDSCFEWGSGRSTAWLAQRTGSVQSIEHDATWYKRVQELVAPFPAVSVVLVPDVVEPYVAPIATAGEVDVVLIDGNHRDACAVAALDHVAAGGLIVIDDVERYLPSSSRSPQAIGHTYATGTWRQFGERTSSWRRIWTSSGVTDTAVFFRA